MESADIKKNTLKNIYLTVSIISLIIEIVVLAFGYGLRIWAGIPLFMIFFAMALYARKTFILKGVSFTFLVFAFIAGAMYYPNLFKYWGFDTRVLVVP
ncbi:MAG TPA: hypothetical protein ENH82_13245, partial [bacterium]|nr:hypothetical protein [bacterium]